MANTPSKLTETSVEEWVDRIIEETKDDEPKNPEACHKFFLQCPVLYPN